MYVLDGVMKAVGGKISSRTRTLGISHCPTDPVKIFRSLLRKYGTNLCGENKLYGNLFEVWNRRIWGSL